ncbi:MAG: hypothetical protein ACRD12_14040 [Acidimicrobiales bacterium]
MGTVRRYGALLLASVIVGAFLIAVPAGAQDSTTTQTAPEAFVASASARGLHVTLLGINLTVGTSAAAIDSTGRAKAQGAGVLEPLFPGTVANAEVTELGKTAAPPKACQLNLPLIGLLTVAAACGEARATTVDSLPAAIGSGTVAEIDLGGSLLNPLIDQVATLVGNTVGAVLDQLVTLLGNLVQPLLGSLNLNVNSLVDDLLAGLKRATGVLTIEAGTSTASAATTASKIVSNGLAQGATIKVLPGLALSGAPLLTITVGEARATVEVTRAPASQGGAATAVATPSFQGSIVNVELGLPLLGNITSIPVGLGQSITLLDGTPLRSVISLGAGSTKDGPDGTKIAIADGVSIQLLTGLSGGIGVSLAHAEATGGGRSAVISIQQKQVTPVVPVPELAKTGQSGGAAWFPTVGAALLLLALVVRRTARSPRPAEVRAERRDHSDPPTG